MPAKSHSYTRRLPIIGETALEPLRLLGVRDGRGVFVSAGEVLFSNDEGLFPREAYPGSRLPPTRSDVPIERRYPVPDSPGEYCKSADDFAQLPKFMAQWVHWPEHVELTLQGRYSEIRPVHFEGIFTLVCNFMCPHCSRRTTRSQWVEGGTWESNTEVDTRNTMHPEDLKRVIDQISCFRQDGQMGIIWGGGDPTASPFTYDAMLYARSKNITASFLTNGVYLEVDRCLDADPVLIRISLNCGTEEAYRKFHGYPRGWDYFTRAKANLRELSRRKLERRANTLVGVSLIVDERNLSDLSAAVGEIVAAANDAGPGIDYVIIRPVMNYSHFEREWAQLQADTKQRAEEVIDGPGGAREALAAVGIPLIRIKDSFDEKPPDEYYDEFGDDRCLAYGVAGEIRHNGDVQLCSDSYGNPEYTIGNLVRQDIGSIWTSERRREVLSAINRRHCWRTTCPHNSRGHHYNRLFHKIEKLRTAGRIDAVRQWAEDLRAATLPLGHSFFI